MSCDQEPSDCQYHLYFLLHSSNYIVDPNRLDKMERCKKKRFLAKSICIVTQA